MGETLVLFAESDADGLRILELERGLDKIIEVKTEVSDARLGS